MSTYVPFAPSETDAISLVPLCVAPTANRPPTVASNDEVASPRETLPLPASDPCHPYPRAHARQGGQCAHTMGERFDGETEAARGLSSQAQPGPHHYRTGEQSVNNGILQFCVHNPCARVVAFPPAADRPIRHRPAGEYRVRPRIGLGHPLVLWDRSIR
jgi:hypothetical protein